jgi:hypothetical protein
MEGTKRLKNKMQDQVLFTSRPLLHIIIKPARKENGIYLRERPRHET